MKHYKSEFLSIFRMSYWRFSADGSVPARGWLFKLGENWAENRNIWMFD